MRATPGDTILTRLTPPGKAAIAVLGLAGPHAWSILAALFTRPGSSPLPTTPQAGAILHGRLGDAAFGYDEVVVHVRALEPEILIEIDCHGGPEVVRLLVRQLESTGARIADDATWLRRNLPEEESQVFEMLMRCPTERTAAIALDFAHGAFGRAQVEIVRDRESGHAERARNRLERLADLIPLGRHLSQPWKVVLAGSPNVGKSSLVNALAGFTRSVVSSVPGTTRDVVTASIALDGWPIELTDTAGLRLTHETLEAGGIARADTALASADLTVWVLDGSVPPAFPITDTPRRLVVVNKVDLPAAWQPAGDTLRLSARTGEGLPNLVAAIVQALVPSPPAPGEAVPLTDSAREWLRTALRDLDEFVTPGFNPPE